METKQSTRQEYQKRINIIVEYINNHLDEELNLNHLAEISFLSPFHFHRITRAFLKEPIGAYITRLRVEKAAELLRYTELSIQEIAYSIGYEIPSSLSKSFRQFYNISPNEFRNNKNFTIMKKVQINEELNLKGPKFVELETKTALYIRIVGGYGNNEYDKVWQKLWAQVKDQKLFGKGIEHIGVSHDDPKVTEAEKCRYDACLVIPKPAKPTGEIGVKEIAGGKYAKFVYQGSYHKLDQVYDTIYCKWLTESGMELRDVPCFEKYISNPNQVSEEKLKTEIYIPVK